MHIHRAIVIAAALATICAGCTAAGGGSGNGPGTPGGPIALGARGVPGGTVTVSSSGAMIPGTQHTFRLAIAGDLAPTGITAWIMDDEQPTPAGVEAVPSAAGPGIYEVNLRVPSPMPASSHVWVSMVFADGATIETGTEDFPLNGP